MKPILWIIVLAVLGAGAFLGGQYLRANGAGGQLTLYGNVDIREVQLAFRVPGRVQTMHFEEGDQVQTGDVVAQLDATPQLEAVAVAEARVAEARAGLDLFMAGTRPQEVERVRAQVQEAEAGLYNATLEFLRQQDLVSQQLSSQRLLDDSRTLRDQWAARLEQAEEALSLALEGFRNEDIARAEASLAAAIGQLNQAQTALGDTELLAPNSGIIMTRVLEPGSMVAVGASVYTLSLTENTYIRAYVSEPNLGRVVPGTRVSVSTDSSSRRYAGQIGFVSPRAEFTPKTVETPDLRTDLVYRLRIVVDDADDGLRQGMPVTLHFTE
ncbi:MAG: secretion protein HlyD [Pseudomonadota bacterium]